MKRALNFGLIFLLFWLTSLSSFSQLPPAARKLPPSFSQALSSGQNLISEGQFNQALRMLEKSLSLARTLEEKKSALFYLAETSANLGQLAQAYEYYNHCLELAQQLEDTKAINYCEKSLEILDLYNQAKSHRQNNQHEAAVEIFNRALVVCDSIKNDVLKMKCLRQKSFSLLELKNFEDFLKGNIKVNKIAKELKNSSETIISILNIGHYYFLNNNISLAIEYFSQAISFINEDTQPQDIFDIYYNMAVVHNEIGNYAKAIEYFSNALNIISGDSSNPYYSATLNNLGFSYVKSGLVTGSREDFDRAFDYFSQALSEAEKTDNKKYMVAVFNNLGSLKAHLEDNLDALYYLNKARALAEELQLNSYLASVYTNIGIVYARLGDYQNSTLYYDKAINLALSENEDRTLWESYLEKANLLRKQGQSDQAKFYYLNSINIIESLRSQLLTEEDKANFFGTDKRLDAYHNLIDLLIQEEGATKEAFSYMERAKARSFLESIEASRISQQLPVDIRLTNKEKELMSDLSRIYTRLITPELTEEDRTDLLSQVKRLEEELENVRRQMRSANPAFASLTYPEIINHDQAKREFVDSQTAVFAFMVGKDSAYGFCLSRAGLKVYPVPAQKELREKVIRYRRAITDTDNLDFSSGQELFRILLEPGMESGIKKLLIAPDDILNILPFETLTLSDRPGDWLIKHYTISYAPSLSSLKELVHYQNRSKRPRPSQNLLAVGDPYYGELEEKYPELSTKILFQDLYSLADMKFYRLAFSSEEVRKISAEIPKSKVLTREKASEDLVKRANLSDYRIIHLAAHGLIDDQKPARSAIVLSLDNDPAEDGFLQMREILNLKLNADLVILSSCQTGLGQFIRGEGIEGLSRAFFYAGASSVLMSLWTVNDQVTSQLMQRFYFHLKSAESLSEALRAVKLEMIESGVVSHPYYWAPFILNGHGDIRMFAPKYRTPLLLGLSVAGLLLGAFFFRRKLLNHKKGS